MCQVKVHLQWYKIVPCTEVETSHGSLLFEQQDRERIVYENLEDLSIPQSNQHPLSAGRPAHHLNVPDLRLKYPFPTTVTMETLH